MGLFDSYKKISLLNQGVKLKRQGKYEDALNFYNKALEIDPDYDKAWFNKGMVSLKLKKNYDAILYFERGLT